MEYQPKPHATRKSAVDHSQVASIHKPESKPKHTGGVPKPPMMPTKRPMVGNDKAMNTKYGSASHNNGYTN